MGEAGFKVCETKEVKTRARAGDGDGPTTSAAATPSRSYDDGDGDGDACIRRCIGDLDPPARLAGAGATYACVRRREGEGANVKRVRGRRAREKEGAVRKLRREEDPPPASHESLPSKGPKSSVIIVPDPETHALNSHPTAYIIYTTQFYLPSLYMLYIHI